MALVRLGLARAVYPASELMTISPTHQALRAADRHREAASAPVR